MWRRFAALVFVIAVACGASEDEIKKEFADWVAQNNACAADADCALVSPGCPLGCSTAVRADRKQAAESKARELIDSYQRAGRSCVYECVGGLRAACVTNRCAVVTQDPP